MSVPREGIHSYRVFDYAVVDVALTVGGGHALSRVSNYSFLSCVVFLFVVGTGVHHAMGINTKFMTDVLGMDHSKPLVHSPLSKCGVGRCPWKGLVDM